MSTEYRQFHRFNVIGTSGSGKTTFSQQLAEILAIPYVQMDALFWEPNWYAPRDDEFLPKVQRALEQDAWVLDGNYTRTIPIKWAKVECVIWLDYAFWQTMRQAVGRAVSRSISGQELWEGTDNRESFRRSFMSQDSIVWYTLRSYAKTRRRIAALMTDPQYAGIRFVRLTSRQAADRFLESLRQPHRQ
jgi:adenylate kinase family enzyme